MTYFRGLQILVLTASGLQILTNGDYLTTLIITLSPDPIYLRRGVFITLWLYGSVVL